MTGQSICWDGILAVLCESDYRESNHVLMTSPITYRVAGIVSHIAGFMGPTWSPPGSCRPQIGPILAPWSLLSGLTWSIANTEYRMHKDFNNPLQYTCDISHMHSLSIYISPSSLINFDLQKSYAHHCTIEISCIKSCFVKAHTFSTRGSNWLTCKLTVSERDMGQIPPKKGY